MRKMMIVTRRVPLILILLCVGVRAETVVSTLAAGTNPLGIATNPVTNKIYIANQADGSVTVINGSSMFITTVSVGSVPFAVAANTVTNKIYVINQSSGTMSVIDGATDTVAATVAVGTFPYGVAVNPTTNKIYVANQGSANVTVVDGATNSTVAVAAGTNPYRVAINPVTNKIYVPNFGSANVTVIDGATNVPTMVAAGTNPNSVAVNPVTNKIYVGNSGSANVTVIDGSSNSTATVSAGTTPNGVSVNPLTNRIYVANNGSNNVTVINGSDNTTTTVSAGTNPNSVAFNPMTNRIYVPNGGSSNVTIIDGNTNATTTVAAGTNPFGIAINPVTNRIYVANDYSANVTVIDGAINATVQVATGTSPVGMAVNPVTNKIYVTNYTGNNVTVFDGTTLATSLVATGTGPQGIAVNPVTNKIYVGNRGSNNVTVIDGASNASTSVSVGATPYAVAVNPVTNKIYVANEGSNNVTVIDGTTNTTITVATGAAPFDLAVNSATNKIYVANDGDNTATVIDGVTNIPLSVATGSNPYAVAINPVTNKIYVANANSNNVTVIDGTTNNATTVTVGTFPVSVAVNPATNKIYVANVTSGNVTVIDGTNNSTAAVAAGTNPASVAVNPATNKIYVSNNLSNNLTVIDGATNVATTTATGSNPNTVAVNPATNQIYVVNNSSNNVTVISPNPPQPAYLVTGISTLPGNRASTATPSFTIGAASTFFPIAPAVLGLYYQVDTQAGTWTRAGAGPTATFSTAALNGGIHTLYAYATDGQDATSTNTGMQSSPLPGAITSYTFVVSATATVNLSGLTNTYDGIQKSASVTTTPAGLATSVAYNGSATAPTNAGSYAVVATITDPSYTGSSNGTLVISQASQTITFGPLPNRTYGGSAFPLTATSTSGLPVRFSVVSGPVSSNGNTLTMTGAGTATVQADQDGSSNYAAALPIQQSFTVNTAALTVTANPSTKVFGTVNPAFSASFAGFVNGESAAALGGTLTFNTSAVTNSPVGPFLVTPSGLTSNNYAISFVNGTLTINPAPATVLLSGLTTTFNFATQSAATTTSPPGLTTAVTYNGIATSPTNAGSYTVSATITDPNYTGSTFGTFVISKATPVITWAKPTAVVAGTPLSTTQLNATANIPGTFAYSPPLGTVLGVSSQTLTAYFTPTDGANHNPTMATVTISIGNATPVIGSRPTASPNPTTAGQPTAFVVTATDADNDALTYSWDFGDGTTGSGNFASHTYISAGTFTAKVTVTDAAGAFVSDSVAVAVAVPPGNGVIDPFIVSNPNGIPDEMQSAASGAGITSVGEPNPLPDAKLAIKLNFAKAGSDGISLSGTVVRIAGFNANGQPVVIDVGGVLKTFTLNGSGKVKSGKDSFAIALKGSNTASAKFTMKLSGGAFAAPLANHGLTNADANQKAVNVPVGVLFNGQLYVVNQVQTYSAKKGKTGTSKDKK